LRIHHRSDGEVAAELGPLLLRVVRGGSTTDEAVDRLVEMLEGMLARWPAVGVLIIVEHGTPRPTPEIRRRVDAVLRRHGERVVIGYAFLGLGFWSFEAREFAAERAAALGEPVFVEVDVEQLARRMSLELVGIDPERIVRTVAQLQADLVGG